MRQLRPVNTTLKLPSIRLMVAHVRLNCALPMRWAACELATRVLWFKLQTWQKFRMGSSHDVPEASEFGVACISGRNSELLAGSF